MPFYQVAQEARGKKMDVIEYGPCRQCGASTIMCKATQTESGLVCIDCLVVGVRAKDRVAPLTGRLADLVAERDALERRLSHVRKEMRELSAELRRQTSYGQ